MDLLKPKRRKPPLTSGQLLYELGCGAVGVTIAYCVGMVVWWMQSEGNFNLLSLFVIGFWGLMFGKILLLYTGMAWGMIVMGVNWNPELWRSWGVVVLYGAIGLVALALYRLLTRDIMLEMEIALGNIAVPLVLQSVIIMVVPYWRFDVLRR